VQRMQAVVSAAHARARQEEEAWLPNAAPTNQNARPALSTSQPRPVPGGADGLRPSNGTLPQLPTAVRGRLSHEDAELDTDQLPRLVSADISEHPRRGARKLLRRRPRHRGVALAVAAAVAATAGPLVIALSAHHPATGAPDLGGAAARNQAAAWVAQEVSSDDVVSCDLTMCLALESHGVWPGNLLRMDPARDLLSSQVIVSTATVRRLFGPRLDTVYAPTVIARFGSGSARIDVRVIAPRGAAAQVSDLRADLQQRRTAGAALAAFPKISASAAARRQLSGGQVDARLMFVISFLATANRLDIVSFGDSGPGAGRAIPLRSVTLAGGTGALRSMLDSVRSPRAPYRAARSEITEVDHRRVLVIEFAAPGPLGLINGTSP